MEYEKIANSVIASAVRNHLRTELKVHCGRVAKAKATAWLKKNSKAINDAVEKAVEDKLNKELPKVIGKAARSVQLYRRGY